MPLKSTASGERQTVKPSRVPCRNTTCVDHKKMIPAGSEILGTVGLSKFENTYAHKRTLMTQMGVFGVPMEMLKYTKLNWALRHCKNICRLKSSLRAPPCHPLQGGGEKDGNICSATNAYCMFYSRYSESHAPLNSSPSDETRSC